MLPILTIDHLTKTYASGFQALKGISLAIEPGEIFALLGPNGAGKTTLISIACGIVRASSGRVTVGGHDIVSGYRSARAHDRARASGTHHGRLRERLGHGLVQPRPLRQAQEPTAHREGLAGPVALGQARREADDAVGRHEAARADRQSPLARAETPVPRRTDGRRRRHTPSRHVAPRPMRCATRASPSS